MGDGQTAAAYPTDPATVAGGGTRPVAPGRLGLVDLRQALFTDIAQTGGELPAGMHLALGQQGEKIEGRPAAVALSMS